MTKLMIVVGSVRPGRIGLPIAQWARGEVEKSGLFDEIDFVDLAELALPFMDEPAHPSKREYIHDHTKAWSARVDAADAFLFVTPEYNHSYSPALKNAIDYLNQEWWMKPYGFVTYGGVSAGTRGAAALTSVLAMMGLLRAGAVELPFAGKQVVDGVFTPDERESAIIIKELATLARIAGALRTVR